VLNDLDGPVVVAVIAVWVVQVAADNVVGVLAVGDRHMAAVRSVLVVGVVFGAVVGGCAGRGVAVADRQRVALDAGLVVVM
jgi:hypothetical protein